MGLYTISETVHMNAPMDRCFLLVTSIELATRTMEMRPLGARKTGFIQPNDRIIWHGWRFGFPWMHEMQVAIYDRPSHFQDTMGRGRFKRFQHDQTFSEIDGHTLLHDKLRFSLPLGFLGNIVAEHVMVPYLSRLLHRRLQILKRIAETEEWRKYLHDEPEAR